MDVCSSVRSRLLSLCNEYGFTVNHLAMEAAVPPSPLKSILYGNSLNPGIVTIKMLCDGFGISLTEFFDTPEFRNLEQEIK